MTMPRRPLTPEERQALAGISAQPGISAATQREALLSGRAGPAGAPDEWRPYKAEEELYARSPLRYFLKDILGIEWGDDAPAEQPEAEPPATLAQLVSRRGP